VSDDGDGTPEDLDELFDLESEEGTEPDSETASEIPEDNGRAGEPAEDGSGEGLGWPDTTETASGTEADKPGEKPSEKPEAAGTSRDGKAHETDGDGATERPREPDVFDRFSADVAGREGDPFEHLGDASGRDGEGPVDVNRPEEPGVSASDGLRDAGDGSDAGRNRPGSVATEGSEAAGGPQAEPGAGTGIGRGDATDADAGRGGATDVDVGDPFAGSVDPRGDPFDGADSVFEEIDVTEVDPDEVWEALASAESRGSVSETRQHTYAEVPKHRYCEQCEWFSEPPDVHCTHEGTEILEFLDMETVRLVDCPVVAERRELEGQD